MEKHFRNLGWIHLVIGICAGLIGLVFLVETALEPSSQGTMTSPDFGFGFAIIFCAVFFIAPGGVVVLNGHGLLSRRPWARVMTIVLSVLAAATSLVMLVVYISEAVDIVRGNTSVGVGFLAGIVGSSLGSAIAVYGLWAMLRPGAAAAWAGYVSRKSGPDR